MKLTKLGGRIDVPESWREFFVSVRPGDRIMVLGEPDSGKSTFCRALVKNLKGAKRILLIDTDPGQQTLSLPSTVASAIVFPSNPAMFSKVEKFFIGKVTPRGAESKVLFAIQLFSTRHADIYVLDSSGWFKDFDALIFNFSQALVFRPTKLVILSRSKAWASVYARVLANVCPAVRVLEVSQKAKEIPKDERARIRYERFKRYFSRCTKKIRATPWREGKGNVVGFFRDFFTVFLGLRVSENEFLVPQNAGDFDFALVGDVSFPPPDKDIGQILKNASNQ